MTLRPALLLLCLPLWSCADPAAAPPPDPPTGSQGAYDHTPSGLVFPADIDHFHRVDIFRQDRQARSVSVGYTMDDAAGPITAVIHVYPATVASGSLALFGVSDVTTSQRSRPELAALERELLRLHPSLRVTAEDDAFLVQNGADQSGREATLSFVDTAITPPQPTIVDAYAFCCRARDRTVIYRFQYPRAAAGAPLAIATFMRDLPWGDQPDEDGRSHHEAPPMPH